MFVEEERADFLEKAVSGTYLFYINPLIFVCIYNTFDNNFGI